MNLHWKRTFILIWIGQFLSLVSSSAVNFAIIIWLSMKTGSAEVLAWSAIAAMLPQALIGPFAGIYVDRWSRKTIMIVADGFIALCTLLMSVNLYAGNESLWLIYTLLALRSVGSAFHMPAMQAAVPTLAPQDQLLRIAGINQIIQSASTIAGPALGALAISLLPISQVLWMDIIGALVAISALLPIHIPKPDRSHRQLTSVRHHLEDIHEGLMVVWENRGLSWLFFYSIVATFCIMPIAVMFPLLTINHFGGGEWEMTLIEVIWGVGMLVGGTFLGILKPSWSKVAMINLMHIILGVTLALSGYIPPGMFAFFVVLTAIGGLAASIYNASFTTILQEEIVSDKLGRVFSMYFSLAIFPSIIGLMSTGFVANVIGINLTFILLGSAIIVVGIASFFTPVLIRLGKK
ncbi:MAG: MFS transporter [Breznakibacter sp.]